MTLDLIQVSSDRVPWPPAVARPVRHTVYGNTAKEARDKAAEIRARLRANLPAKDRKITLGEFTAEWIDSSLEASDRKATTKNLYGTMARIANA